MSDVLTMSRAVLIRLIPVNLLLGYLPSANVIQQYKLAEFLPLIQAFRQGNVSAFRHELRVNREWYRSHSIWLILYERGEILVWRNLFRQALRLYYQLNHEAPKNRCPTWVFMAASQKMFEGSGEVEEGGIVIEDIICIMSSLIDQVSAKRLSSASERSHRKLHTYFSMLTGILCTEPRLGLLVLFSIAAGHEAGGGWNGRVPTCFRGYS